MGKRIVFMGAGAVGGYVGGHLARTGEDVTLIDPWPEHIEHIKQHGIHLSGTQGEHTVRLKALHLHEVQGLFKQPADIAFICTKSYDTEWATMLIKQYLAPDGFVVSLQNSINEERIAHLVGWGKVVGCIASTIGVDAYQAGHVIRTLQPGGSAYTIFRVGEVHGRITARVQELVRMLSAVDSAKVTTNLWGERWSKLTHERHGEWYLGLHRDERQGYARVGPVAAGVDSPRGRGHPHRAGPRVYPGVDSWGATGEVGGGGRRRRGSRGGH